MWTFSTAFYARRAVCAITQTEFLIGVMNELSSCDRSAVSAPSLSSQNISRPDTPLNWIPHEGHHRH
jgi:hypothetical protein